VGGKRDEFGCGGGGLRIYGGGGGGFGIGFSKCFFMMWWWLDSRREQTIEQWRSQDFNRVWAKF
jgi:hypothetical protein